MAVKKIDNRRSWYNNVLICSFVLLLTGALLFSLAAPMAWAVKDVNNKEIENGSSPIWPIFEGAEVGPNGTHIAHWGWHNLNSIPIEIPLGTDNYIKCQVIEPIPDQVPPTYFSPGRVFNNFTLIFGQNMQWHLSYNNNQNDSTINWNTCKKFITVSFESGSYVINEGETANISVILNAQAVSNVTVNYSSTIASGTLTFTPGVVKQYIEIPTVQNDVYDGTRNIDIGLIIPDTDANAGPGAIMNTTLTIIDDEPAPVISISPLHSVNEGDGTISVSVTKSGNTSVNASVDYSTNDGTAEAVSDYLAASGTLTFLPSETEKTVYINIVDDGIPEIPELFFVNLTDPVDATLSQFNVADIIINDNDLWPSVEFNLSSYTFNETDGTVTFTVIRTGNPIPASVNYSTNNGTALSGSDYASASGKLFFGLNENEKTFTVNISDDSLGEGDEFFFVNLSDPVLASLGSNSIAIVNIVDNEPKPAVQFSSPRCYVDENDGSIVVTVSMTGQTSRNVTVDYATGNGTAEYGLDYTAASGTLTFEPGDTSKTFRIYILDDVLAEDNETINLTLSNLSANAVFGTRVTSVVEIIDDDSAETSFVINLQPGWNLISIPLMNDTIWASQLQDIGISMVAEYVNTTDGFNMYMAGISPSEDDIQIKIDYAYYVFCDRETTFTVIGVLPGSRSIAIYSGYNMIGWSTLSTSNAKAVCELLNGNQIIFRYNNANDGFDVYMEMISPDEDSFVMGPGEGYYVYSDSAETQTLPFGGV
ncbi:Calx-beta domain-containing protein [Methanooceanicella nereidis]|nr:Calx-beta domain-containing protein [Methanocella sp. CWC-04]